MIVIQYIEIYAGCRISDVQLKAPALLISFNSGREEIQGLCLFHEIVYNT